MRHPSVKLDVIYRLSLTWWDSRLLSTYYIQARRLTSNSPVLRRRGAITPFPDEEVEALQCHLLGTPRCLELPGPRSGFPKCGSGQRQQQPRPPSVQLSSRAEAASLCCPLSGRAPAVPVPGPRMPPRLSARGFSLAGLDRLLGVTVSPAWALKAPSFRSTYDCSGFPHSAPSPRPSECPRCARTISWPRPGWA